MTTFQGVIKFIADHKKTAIVKSCIYNDSHPSYKLVFIKGNFSSYKKGDVIKYQFAPSKENTNVISIVA